MEFLTRTCFSCMFYWDLQETPLFKTLLGHVNHLEALSEAMPWASMWLGMAASKAAPYCLHTVYWDCCWWATLKRIWSPDALSSGFRERFDCLLLQISQIAWVIMSHIIQKNLSYLPPKNLRKFPKLSREILFPFYNRSKFLKGCTLCQYIILKGFWSAETSSTVISWDNLR